MHGFRIAAWIAAATWIAVSAAALAEGGAAEQKKECRDDISRFCAGLKGDADNAPGECLQVLKAHLRFLAPECRKFIETDRVSN